MQYQFMELVEREEHRVLIEKDLDNLIKRFRKGILINKKEVFKLLGNFIALANSILLELELLKRKVLQEIYKKLEDIRSLTYREAQISSEKIRKRLFRIEQKITSRIESRLAKIQKIKLKKISFEKEKRVEIDSKRKLRLSELLAQEERALLGKISEDIDKPELEKEIIKFLEEYEEDVNFLFDILSDLELEQFGQLARIDDYTLFLNQYRNQYKIDIPHLGDLQLLKEKQSSWISEDKKYEKDLRKRIIQTELFEKELLIYSSAQKTIFPDVIPKEFNIGEIIGTLYFKKDINFKAGVVVVHGLWGTRKFYELLGKRLADQSYLVYIFNLPSHGESQAEFTMGLISEWIHISAKTLRERFGVRKIGVVGHSLGAMAAIFAACGYNKRVEREIYVLMERYLTYIEQLSELLTSKNYDKELFINVLRNQFETYSKIRNLIIEIFKEQMFRGRRINAFVFLGPPKTIQMTMPPWLAKLSARIHQKTYKKIINVILNIPVAKKAKKKYTSAEEYFPVNLTDDEVYWVNLHYSNQREFMSYITGIKNPLDYLNLINHFYDITTDGRTSRDDELFLRYFDLIRNTPKLFIYGNIDLFFKLWLKRFIFPIITNPIIKRKMRKMYAVTGKHEFKFIEKGHSMNIGNVAPHVIGKVQSPRITAEVIKFLNIYLVGGAKLPS